jgi:elongation factor G
MDEYVAGNIRNIALVGHGGAGKTTLTESLLFATGTTNRLGTIESGNTVSDYSVEEQERQYSLNASLVQFESSGTKINILDTPGYSDFIGEAIGALRAVDNAVVVINAQTGVEVGTELLWGYANDYSLPRMIVVNACSREHADFDQASEQAKERFGSSIIVAQYPVNQGEGFNQIVDLLSQKLYTYEVGGKGTGTASDIPADLQDQAAILREELVDAIAESDEALLEKYLEGEELDEKTVVAALKNAVKGGLVVPLVVTDAAHGIGIDRFIEWTVSILPSPVDMDAIEATTPGDGDDTVAILPDENEPLSAYVFKTVSEEHVGELSFVRVYSGTMGHNVDALNTSQDASERIGKSFFLVGHEKTDAVHIRAGDIGALVKLRNTHTGDTLANPERPVILAQASWPTANIQLAVSPKTKGDEDKLGSGLHRLHEEDPSFTHVVDGEVNQTLISGQGELHLGVKVKQLKDRFGVEVETDEPLIAYRETIRKKAESHYRHKKQTGGRGQFGDVHLRIEPLPRGGGYEFDSAVVGGVIPGKFIPAVEKGVVEALTTGIIAGATVVDVKATVFDGSHHAVDSSEIAFKLAGFNAFRQAMEQASPVLLEPIYDIEVTVPEEFMGDVMGDLTSRRGRIGGMDANGPFQVIKAQVPLANLHRYSTELRSMTGGRGIFSRAFSRYEEAPAEVAAQIAEQLKKREEEAE